MIQCFIQHVLTTVFRRYFGRVSTGLFPLASLHNINLIEQFRTFRARNNDDIYFSFSLYISVIMCISLLRQTEWNVRLISENLGSGTSRHRN